MTIEELEAMDTGQLELASRDVETQIDSLRTYRRAIVAVLDRKLREDRAVEMLSTLSDPQKRALVQVLGAEGTASAGIVGKPETA